MILGALVLEVLRYALAGDPPQAGRCGSSGRERRAGSVSIEKLFVCRDRLLSRWRRPLAGFWLTTRRRYPLGVSGSLIHPRDRVKVGHKGNLWNSCIQHAIQSTDNISKMVYISHMVYSLAAQLHSDLRTISDFQALFSVHIHTSNNDTRQILWSQQGSCLGNT